MIPKCVYRLSEYRIAEYADGRLWWDAHTGLASQIGGPCYILGNVLLIGTGITEEDGFLKLEFLEKLKQCPPWRKTRYYCFASALLDTSSGKHVDEKKLGQALTFPRQANAFTTVKSGNFRLGHYRISVAPDGVISWEAFTGINRVACGTAMIESDILLIGPESGHFHQHSKKQFLRGLHAFPKWRHTTFWCRGLILKSVPEMHDEKRSFREPDHEAVKRFRKAATPDANETSGYAKRMMSIWSDHASDLGQKMTAGCKKIWSRRKKLTAIKNKFQRKF